MASLTLACIVCGPALTALFATQVSNAPAWMSIVALLMVVAMPFMWRVAWSGDAGVSETTADPYDAA